MAAPKDFEALIGRRIVYAFVSLPLEEMFGPVFEAVAKVVTLRGLEAVRSERIHDQTTPSVVATIEQEIRDSRFIIADLTGSHANVLQEVRYASELGKPRILISQEAPEQATFNVQGLNIHPYDVEDLDRLQSLLLTLAVDLSSTEESRFAETPFDGTISAKMGLMDIVSSQWKNPFADG